MGVNREGLIVPEEKIITLNPDKKEVSKFLRFEQEDKRVKNEVQNGTTRREI